VPVDALHLQPYLPLHPHPLPPHVSFEIHLPLPRASADPEVIIPP